MIFVEYKFMLKMNARVHTHTVRRSVRLVLLVCGDCVGSFKKFSVSLLRAHIITLYSFGIFT